MSAGEFLFQLAQALLVLLTLWQLVEWARHRDVARRDIALLLLTVAIGVVLHWLQANTAVDLGGAVVAVPLAIVLHPLLLLLLVDHFRAVPRWVAGLVAGGVVASWAILLAVPPDWAAPGAVAVRVIFALSTLYAARGLVGGTRHAQGVVRRRMGLVGAGAVVVALLAALHLLDEAVGVAHADTAIQVGLLVAAGLYTLGLAPPPWLSRAWQQTDVQQFLRAAAGSAGEAPEKALLRLIATARHAVGAQAVALARWHGDRKRLELELRGERALVGGPLPPDGLVSRQWTFRRPFVADDRKEVRAACARLAPGLDCTALIGIPVITPSRVWGLLVIFLRRSPVLPDDDLRLLQLITEHTAVFLDHAVLVESLRREIGVLRGEPLPDETPLDES